MADEEPVDPKKYLEDSCKPKCVRPHLAYKAEIAEAALMTAVARRYLRCKINLGAKVPQEPGRKMSYRHHRHKACIDRIKGDESGHKHCTGQYFDYWRCIDKCVAPILFAKLK